MRCIYFIILVILFTSCSSSRQGGKTNVLTERNKSESATSATPSKPMLPMDQPLDINRGEFISYAKKFVSVPYLYASSDPAKGFDCSGFLFYIFKHFNVKSPRSSYDYEHVGKKVDVKKAQPGDLILFTASDTTKIGHIGIITETRPQVSFIHASTAKGVIISPLSGYYLQHFVKITSVLK